MNEKLLEITDFSFDPVSKVIRIGTVTMSLKSGDITKERADAIVNSTNERMDMTGGEWHL